MTLEDQLSTIFQLKTRWNALVLLDEADVFLERRTTENLVRHSLVSVFLRRLEYFRGILVLTTNRVENFDEAILSRIHIQLRYGELNADTRRKIWKIFLGSLTHSNISEKELGFLIKKPLNGRQIKNNVATARALVTKKKARVSFSHLQTIIAAGEAFDRDLKGTHHSERMYT
ncbi:hypothetical protein LTR66_004132 [Elasticomyces elasticus]|nr:hypothetical protein LTR66_004132 [Elasticomyces elasticus]